VRLTSRYRTAIIAAIVIPGAYLATGLIATPVAGTPVLATAPEAVCTGGVPDDFDGDGHADVAVSQPNGTSAPGAVRVLYGTASGLGTARNQNLDGGGLGSTFTPTAGDGFGTALAVGDFNHDGCADLAVTAPGKTGHGVIVVYWSAA